VKKEDGRREREKREGQLRVEGAGPSCSDERLI